MSRRPARWECTSCRRLIGEIEDGRLRLARSVEVAYVVPGGVAICCPGCNEPRVWRDAQPVGVTSSVTG